MPSPWEMALRKLLEFRLEHTTLTDGQRETIEAESDVRRQAGLLTKFEMRDQ